MKKTVTFRPIGEEIEVQDSDSEVKPHLPNPSSKAKRKAESDNCVVQMQIIPREN